MKKFILVLCLFLVLTSFIVYSDNDGSNEDLNELGMKYRPSEKEVKEASKYKTGIKAVTMQDITDYLVRKLNQIIFFLKWISQPVSVLAFMISSLMFIYNVVVKNNWSNIKGMIISVVAYACILFANDIFMIFLNNA